MKVLIVSHSCTIPVGQQLYAEVERLTGWDLTIITPALWKDPYGNHLSTKRWPDYKGNIISIPVWKSGNVPLHTYRSLFLQLIKEVNPDFIYLYQEPYAVVTFQVYLANFLSLRKPIGFCAWQNIYKRYPFPFHQMESWVLQQTDVMFAGSQSIEEVFRKKGYQGFSTILPLGVNASVYYPQPDAPVLADNLRNGKNQVLIGYVGRIVEQKGLKTLLQALKLIQDLSWQLVIVGTGSYQAKFDTIAQELQLTEQITCVGYVPSADIPRYLSAFDVLVLPSETRQNWKEQFGRVIVESLACGTPIIGSDSGEIPHLLKATEGGLVFAEAQPQDLAKQLRQVINNAELRSQLAEKGREVVLKHYTHPTLASHFVETVKNVTQSHQRE